MYYEDDIARTGCDIANLVAKQFASVYAEPSKTSYVPDFPFSSYRISSLAISEADVESTIKIFVKKSCNCVLSKYI